MSEPRPKSRLIAYIVPAAIVVLAGTAVTALYSLEVLDRAYRYLMTIAAVGGAGILLFLWWGLRSRWTLRSWFFVIVPIVAIVGTAAAMFRMQIRSGDLSFSVTPRWQKTADAELPRASELARADAAEFAAEQPVVESPADYPGFLGRDRLATVPDIKLARDWKARPPRELWRRKVGAGWSAFAVVGAYAVTQEQRDNEELVVCYDTKTGKVRWAHTDPGRFTSVLGGDGPRATPTIHDGKVYAIGATGQLNCLDLATGKLVWATNVLADFKVTPEEDLANVAWGRAGSPLIVDQMVVVPAGGPRDGEFVSLVGYDKDTGKRLRQGGAHQVSYSSPSLATLDGVRQIVIVNEDTITGHDPATLVQLWQHSWPGHSNSDASVPQTVPIAADQLFVSKGYSSGASVFTVRRDGNGQWETKTVWNDPGVLKSKFANVVIYNGYAYGLSDGILECADIKTGERKWKRGRYGHGQLLLAGDLLIVQAESGEVLMIPASPDKAVELGQFQAVTGQSWNNPALAGNLLLVRNSEEAACFELPLAE